MTYSVYCFKFGGGAKLIKSGLSLDEAKEICSDPETSSRTSSTPLKHGRDPWFYGFEQD